MDSVFQYMKEMAWGMLAALPLAAGIRLFACSRRKARGEETTLLHELLAVVFNLSILGILSMTILPELAAVLKHGALKSSGRINLIPFTIFRQTAVMIQNGRISYFLINFLGNILVFIPLGLLPPLLWNRMEPFWKPLLLGFSVSLCIELTQLLLPRGTDIDDIWLNTLGAALGYGIFSLLRRFSPKILPRCRIIPAAERNLYG